MARTGKFKFQIIFGAAMVGFATFMLHTVGVGEAKWHISAFMLAYGLGSGMSGPIMSVIVQSSVDHKYMGVATSGRQYFMQIGQVLGTAIFGVVLATTYASSFSDRLTPEARAELPPATYKAFEDPTLAINPPVFAKTKAEVLALPNGQRILDSTVQAQKESVADAIDNIFLGSVIAAVGMLILAITMPEIPLRRSFGAAASTVRGSKSSDIPVEPMPEALPEIP